MKISAYYRLMRLHQPTGMWLLLWPAWWAIAFASPNYPDLSLLAIFLLGSLVMRSSGCIINDIIDRDIDKHVERTKYRPLASGELSVTQAIICMLILLLIGLGVLLQLNEIAIFLSTFSCLFVIMYPFMKRIMHWPQLFLALTFNFGAMVGWAAATEGTGHIGAPAFTLYIACYFWTLGYDTIYALQDKRDDKKIGINSTAINMGNSVKRYVIIFYCFMIMGLALTGYQIFDSLPIIYTLTLIIAFIQLLWQVISVNEDNPEQCMNRFKSNMYFGWIIFCGILLQKSFIVV